MAAKTGQQKCEAFSLQTTSL